MPSTRRVGDQFKFPQLIWDSIHYLWCYELLAPTQDIRYELMLHQDVDHWLNIADDASMKVRIISEAEYRSSYKVFGQTFHSPHNILIGCRVKGHQDAIHLQAPSRKNCMGQVNDVMIKSFCKSFPEWSEKHGFNIKKCVQCNKEYDLKQCSRCKVIHYCSQNCQRSHLKYHKTGCKFICKHRVLDPQSSVV